MRAAGRAREFADRMVFSNKVRFPGPPKEAAPDFVGVAKITARRVAAFKPGVVYRQEVVARLLEGRPPAGWSEKSTGVVTEVTGTSGVARSTSRDDKKTSGSRNAESERETEREGGGGAGVVAEIGSNGFDEGERGSLTLVIALVVAGKLGE